MCTVFYELPSLAVKEVWVIVMINKETIVNKNNKFIVGWREVAALPDLGVDDIHVKIDTGARSSCLHTFKIEEFTQNDELWVKFWLHPIHNNTDIEQVCMAKVADKRVVRNSGGDEQLRYFIVSTIDFNGQRWPIEISLTSRDNMAFRMLLGRTSMHGRIIVDPDQSLYSTSRLIEAAEQRGHEIKVIDALRCYMNINSQKPSIHFKGEDLVDFDAVIPRIGASVTFYGTAVLRQFEMMGVYAVNESIAISRSRDKLRSMQLLSRKCIGMPVTGFASKPDDVKDLLDMVGGAPVVIKLLEGTQGIGVVLAETRKAAESVIEAFMGLKANIMVQEYIKEAGGADIRCFVIGDKVIAAMKRQGAEGEFRSNLHRGGSAALVKITPEERKTAVAAAKIMGLSVAGVDLLRSERGPLVMEVNSSPGLEGIEKATGKDIAGMIIEYIEKHASKKTALRSQG
jgi:ribosomal protein S6--L-glutamate ligase